LKYPFIFLLGRHDYHVASIVAEKFFYEIKAPKKELVWFEKSAHSACFEEAKEINRLMVDMVLST
jgi:esterase/lipase